MTKLFLVLVLVVTHDTFINPPQVLPPQGDKPFMLAARAGGTLLSRAMFRTDVVKPYHVLDIIDQEQNTAGIQINAFAIVGWDWNEATATWENRQGTTQAPVACVLTFYGDANLDGRVDNADTNILGEHWQQQGDWYDGDFNSDGIVNAKDLNLIGSNFRKDVANVKAEVLFVPKSGDNIALEPVNTGSLRLKTKEAQ